MRRGLTVWLVLLAAYTSTLGVDAAPGQRYTAAEAHRLLAAKSLAEDRSLDLSDEYAARDWASISQQALTPTAVPRDGRLVEPQGLGLVLVTAPAFALGGALGVELLCAALLALAFALSLTLARRLVPDPWATSAVLVAGLSPPALAGATTVGPAPAGAVLLTAALAGALAFRQEPRLGRAGRTAAAVALLPWFGVRFLAPGVVVLAALARWLGRRRGGVTGLVAVEVLAVSAVVLITVNLRLYGGLVPSAAEDLGSFGGAAGVRDAGEFLRRLPALPGTLIGADVGLLRWAPAFALAGGSLWLAYRSRRDLIARALPARLDIEIAVMLLGAVVAAGLAAAALAAPSIRGPWLLPGDVLVVLPAAGALTAWGLRSFPRVGGALVAVTIVASAWLVVGVRLDPEAGLGPPSGRLPWGGLELLLPRW